MALPPFIMHAGGRHAQWLNECAAAAEAGMTEEAPAEEVAEAAPVEAPKKDEPKPSKKTAPKSKKKAPAKKSRKG